MKREGKMAVNQEMEWDDIVQPDEDIYAENRKRALQDPQDENSRLAAAMVLFHAAGDEEAADAAQTLACKLDFDEDDGSSTYAPARKKLLGILKDRKDKCADKYINRMSDEEVLEMIGESREVTEPGDIDYYASAYVKGGFYDPAIFGGSGTVPVARNGKADGSGLGRNMGYMRLPYYCIRKEDIFTAKDILNMSTEETEDLLYRKNCLVLSDAGIHKKGDIIPKEDAVREQITGRCLTGGNALYQMLKATGYEGHPENLMFKILPVLAPYLRPIAFDADTLSICGDSILRDYKQIALCCSIANFFDKNGDSFSEAADKQAVELQKDVEHFFLQKNPEGKGKDKYITIVRRIRMKYPAGAETARQMNMLYRVRFNGYAPSNDKGGEIRSAHIFPDTLQVKEGDKLVPTSFQEIIHSNTDLMNSIENEAADKAIESAMEQADNGKDAVLEYDRETEERLMKMREDSEAMCEAAARQREQLVVEEGKDGLYRLYNKK